MTSEGAKLDEGLDKDLLIAASTDGPTSYLAESHSLEKVTERPLRADVVQILSEP